MMRKNYALFTLTLSHRKSYIFNIKARMISKRKNIYSQPKDI